VSRIVVLPRSIPYPWGEVTASHVVFVYRVLRTATRRRRRRTMKCDDITAARHRSRRRIVLLQENRLGPGIFGFCFWRALRRGSSKRSVNKNPYRLYIYLYNIIIVHKCLPYIRCIYHPSPRAGSTITIHCFFFLSSQGASSCAFSTFHCVDYFVLLLKLSYFFGGRVILYARRCTTRLLQVLLLFLFCIVVFNAIN